MKKETAKDIFATLKEQFKREIAGITNIEELKDIYASEIAKRDKLLAYLQEQNEILIKSALRSKKEELERK